MSQIPANSLRGAELRKSSCVNEYDFSGGTSVSTPASTLWTAVLGFRAEALAERRIAFGLREWSGAFGDIGTDLPLLAGMLIASGMSPGRVLIIFGFCQILSGLIYRLPMPVQPLKVVAALVIAQGISGSIITGAGLAIGVIMLALSLSGMLEWLARLIPVSVVRGIQFGLGAKLCLLAASRYIGSQGWQGYVLVLAAAALTIGLAGRPRSPTALLVLAMGAITASFAGLTGPSEWQLCPAPDAWGVPSIRDVWTGCLLLALPQIPLSLGNSVLATRELAADWFPAHQVTVRKIGLTYSLFNIGTALMGGVPVCHGSGGMAGHYAFGGRTGGSVIIYGGFYVCMGLAVVCGAQNILAFFPLPVLGVILIREGIVLMDRLRGLSDDRVGWRVALLVGIIAAGIPNGFLIGMIAGTALVAVSQRIPVGCHLLPSAEDPEPRRQSDKTTRRRQAS